VRTTANAKPSTWHWGRCPHCQAYAWIDTQDPPTVVCSCACRGFSIWDYLEGCYRWEQEFGDAFGLHSFDDRGRPRDTEEPAR
jgi:hypothetical protein